MLIGVEITGNALKNPNEMPKINITTGIHLCVIRFGKSFRNKIVVRIYSIDKKRDI